MGPRRSIHALAFSHLFLVCSGGDAPMHNAHYHGRAIGRRIAGPPLMGALPGVSASTTPSPGVLAYVTPSPGASPVAVTTESQIVTSYAPQYTLCELPPLAFFPALSGSNSTLHTTSSYQNYSISTPPGNGTCETIYTKTITMVCATTLTALATKYTVSNCAQELTFSTEYGYVLVHPTPSAASTPAVVPSPTISTDINTTAPSIIASNLSPSSLTELSATMVDSTGLGLEVTSSGLILNPRAVTTPGPSIETLTTYLLAPWQQLTAGNAPSEVDLKVCRTFSNGSTECIREYQSWLTSLATGITSTVTSINISTTIHGASQLIVETYVANVTEQITTFSMSTTMVLSFQTEYTTTNSVTRNMSTSTGPTVYETFTLEEASNQHTTSTTTLHITSTVYAGTSYVTVTLPSSTAIPSIAPVANTQIPT